jgi:hypothetical protein
MSLWAGVAICLVSGEFVHNIGLYVQVQSASGHSGWDGWDGWGPFYKGVYKVKRANDDLLASGPRIAAVRGALALALVLALVGVLAGSRRESGTSRP